MSKEKQIEEMFNIIVDGVIDGEDNNGVPTGNTCTNISEALYNAGYRKQSEGEWVFVNGDVGYDEYGCSVCGENVAFFDEEDTYKFCPNCGAKMKGVL